MKYYGPKYTVILLLCSAFISSVSAGVNNIDSALKLAMQTSPEVKASWHDFMAAVEQQRSIKGGYLPRVDIESQIGYENSETPTTSRGSYTPDSTRLVMTQMLFDGFATRHQYARQGYLKLAAYYDFKQASEEVALEVVQAYLDVSRYRRLVILAESNYVQHHVIRGDIEERVTSGIGRRVDLEQATGRLALAESNLLTEMSNLHDVSVRFYRLVGHHPAESLTPLTVQDALIPAPRKEALDLAYRYSPELSAAIERLRATREAHKALDAPMMPRLDLQVRKQLDHNTDGLDGRYDEWAVELVGKYNVYRGGSDSANKREAYELFNRNFELREQVCRNIRQEVVIAHNDIVSLKQQVAYINLNKSSIGMARQAYQKQFDIGQRTLLDLLDSENEYFEVSRRLVRTEIDLEIAKAKTLQGMGLLLYFFNVSDHGSGKLPDMEELRNDDDPDAAYRCPAELPEARSIDKESLLARYLTEDRGPKLKGSQLVFNLNVKFAYKSAALDDTYLQDLGEAANFLIRHPEVKGVIEGHTDSIASNAYNKILSQRRADVTRAYLIEKYNIDGDRLEAVGFGEDRPVASNGTDDGQGLNRRVELVLTVDAPIRKPRLSDFSAVE